MPLVRHDGHVFRVGAEEFYSDDAGFLGYQPWFSSVVQVRDGLAGTGKDTSTTRYVPGPQIQDRVAAIKTAIETLKLNWDAQKTRRCFKVGDKVGDTTTLRVGHIAQDPGYVCGGFAFVLFGGAVEQLSDTELIYLL